VSLSSPPPEDAPTPSVRSASERAILLAALKDAVNAAYERGRQEAIAEMERAGSLKQLIKSADPEPVELGTITQGEGKWVAEVHDEDALLGWVQDHRPGEWYQAAPPIRIRESFIEWLCTDAIRRASVGQPPYPVALDMRVPGVRALWRPGSTTVKANGTAKERAAGILASLFDHGRGLPAQEGNSDEPSEVEASAVAGDVPGPAVGGGDQPAGPGDELARLGDILERLNAIADPGPDRSGGAGGAAGQRSPAGTVVPGPSGGGHGRTESTGAQLAGGLLGAVASRESVPYAHDRSFPHAVTKPLLDDYPAEPEPERDLYVEPDYNQPAPF